MSVTLRTLRSLPHGGRGLATTTVRVTAKKRTAANFIFSVFFGVILLAASPFYIRTQHADYVIFYSVDERN